MKCVLFVDDEPLILEALERTLGHMRREWDMRFARCGKEALQLLAKAPADVVVSDMRMPQMNGAELLNEVMRLHPKTVRLILSGFADLEMILQCIEGTHQFLAKPCSSETLKNVVGRALNMDAWINNEELKTLVSQLRTLPTLPSLYFEILRQLESRETNLEKVGASIAQDPGMTAKMLQMVNSAFFGLRRQLSDPTEAVMQLGLETIKSLVLGIHVFSQVRTDGETDILMQKLWQHSIATAATAQRIAKLEGLDKTMVTEAFTGGLLHDIGRLVLIANLPEQYLKAKRLSEVEGIPMVEAETKIFGTSHAGVGGYLMGLWGLPISLVEAAVFHHCPAQSNLKTMSPLAIVHAANILTQESSGAGVSPSQAKLDAEYFEQLGVSGRLASWRAMAITGDTVSEAA